MHNESSSGIGLFAGLDIGTEKICCAIGNLHYPKSDAQTKDMSIHVLGLGQGAAKGVSYKGITQAELLEDCISSVVSTAESAAKKSIKDVYVNIPSSWSKSFRVQLSLTLSGQTPVQWMHLKKMFSNLPADLCSEKDGQRIVHLWPLSYQLDDITEIHDPVGMIGKNLSATCQLITVSKPRMDNLSRCIGQCNLDIAGFVLDTYADGLAVLADEESELGVTLIDIGGRTTQIACFLHTDVVWTTCIPIGGFHITSDLARGLSTPLVQAERMKILYGNLTNFPKQSAEQIPLSPLIDQKGPVVDYVPYTVVHDIIVARTEELCDLIMETLQKRPVNVDPIVFQKIVITGGGTSLPGMEEFFEKRMNVRVRTAMQNELHGNNAFLNSPSFSTCGGLLKYAVQDYMGQNHTYSNRNLSLWQRISLWFSENI